MKKILTLICCTIVLAATSCKKETNNIAPSATTIFDTTPAFTLANGEGSIHGYTTTLNVPEITEYYKKHGGVLVYLDNSDGTLEQLPNVYGGVTYRFAYDTGVLYIDAQNADGSLPTGANIPPPLNIKIVLVP
ncbi:hypothetical protein AAFN85_08865 [Mucilaginibacter sp. CAU 1740]|uniref:hypothetical protein n=1 Tax=Mucilaginibacter sp. CAU 1740 TaxID=3140365 RepID=UPI00325AC1E8